MQVPQRFPSSLPPPCCFRTSKVRLIIILPGNKWLREARASLLNPCRSFQQRIDVAIYDHPTYGLEPLSLTVRWCPREMKRTIRTIKLLFLSLCMVVKEAQQWWSMLYKMSSWLAGGKCKHRWSMSLRVHTPHTENYLFIVNNLYHFTERTKARRCRAISWPLRARK